jgi:hypothetical protein
MSRLSGQVTLQDAGVQNVPVAIIDTNGSEDPTQWSIVATDTTDANGNWSVSGLATNAVERYHALVQYDDGAQLYNVESLPYLSTDAYLSAPVESWSWDQPTAAISTPSAIPDTGLLHRYNAPDINASDGSDVSTWGDTEGTDDLSDNGSPPSLDADRINGTAAVRHQKSDNELLGVDWTDISPPYEIFLVIQFDSVASNFEYALGGGPSISPRIGHTDTGEWYFVPDSSASGSSVSETTPYIVDALIDSTSELRINGSVDISQSLGTSTLQGLTTAGTSNVDPGGDVSVGEILVYDPTVSGYSRSDVESYLSDKWGITI